MKLYRIISEEKGVSLIMAIAAMTFLSILGYMVISEVVIDNRIMVGQLQATQAFWAAESGIEMAYRWVRFQIPPPGGSASFLKYDRVACGVGTYTVTIDPDDGNPTNYLKTYKLISVGRADSIARKIEVEMLMTTFNRYAYLSGSEGGTIWFNTGDLVEGPLHSNDQISIRLDPVFMGRVTSSANSFNQGTGYNPDFQQGYQLGVPPVTFPTQQAIIDIYNNQNADPPYSIDARFGRNASIDFNADGTLTYSVWLGNRTAGNYVIQDSVVNIIDDLNGYLYVEGDVEIKGTLDGDLTVVATDDIIITDNILYEMSDAGGKPLAGCDDMLGLISLKEVIIARNPANEDDVIIDAALLALDDSFTVEQYWLGGPRGDLTIYGSASQLVRGPVGTFRRSTTTGYQKDYHYDTRFLDTPPPYFPSTGQYHAIYWKEVIE